MARTATTNFFLYFCRSFNIITPHFQETGIDATSVRYFNFPQHQDSKISSRQAIFAFIMGVLPNFLQVKYHGKDKSPFETHPKTMLVAIASLLVYCFSYDAKLRIPANNYKHYKYFLRSIMALSGPLSLASVLSILFPESLSPLLFTVSILFSLCQLTTSQTKTIWNWVIRAAINIMYKFSHQPHQHGGRRRGAHVEFDQLHWLPAAEHGIVNQMDILPI